MRAPACVLAATVFGLGAVPLAAAGRQAKPSQGSVQKIRNPLNDLLDQAQAAMNKNDFATAIPLLQKFIAEKPDVAYVHFQLAYCYTALQRPEDARPEYEKCLALDPKIAEAQLNLGILLLDSDPKAAVPHLQKSVELLPTQSRPRFLLGLAQERSGDLEGAAESFDGAAHLDPKKADAVEAYKAYLAVRPQDAEARSRVVHLLVEQGQNEAAVAELDKNSASHPPTVDELKLRADLEIGEKKFDAAIATLKQAVAMAPNDPQLHGGLGRTYLQARDFPNAEKELKLALQLDRNHLADWKDLVSTYYLSGNCQATLATLDVIAKAETPGAGPWLIRALCYDKLVQIQPALDAYRKFLELDDNKNPDQVWQANQRIHVLEKVAEKKRGAIPPAAQVR